MGRYAGATAPITIGDALKLDGSWACQPKKDGFYVEVHLDARGRVDILALRNGGEVAPVFAHDLVGLHAGEPHAVLIGELEAHTEASEAAIAARGYPLVHLFDLAHDGYRDVSAQPYSVRRDALHRMQVEREEWTGTPIGQRFPIVPQYSIAQVGRWFRDALDAGDEGLVLVNVNAPLGARACKKKLKRIDTLDALITFGPDSWGYWAVHNGVKFIVAKSKKAPDVGPGSVVEIAFEGFLKSGQPKHPRIIRRRPDLEMPERQLELDDLPGDLVARLSHRPDAFLEPWRRTRDIPRPR